MKNLSRRLAAIMFSDIVGYTAMMQTDESLGRSKAKLYRQVIEEKAKEHSGEVVDHYGDGSLCLFNSSLHAVQCAKAIQLAMISADIPLRIGIHVGDISIDGEEIYGSGVNIASRVEALATPGSVVFSEGIHQDLKNHPEFTHSSLGAFNFKNVSQAMIIYALKIEGKSLPTREQVLQQKGARHHKIIFKQKFPSKKVITISTLVVLILIVFMVLRFEFFKTGSSTEFNSAIPVNSIAVLPFEDLSPEKNQEYFSDGIMEEILDHLVKIEGMQVSSRTSVWGYKGSRKSTKEIVSELGVANILEGSVRKSGERVRVTVQLIDGSTDKHIWSQSYDRQMDDVFDIQKSIATSVAEQLKIYISPEVEGRIGNIPTQNMLAYNLFLEARHIMTQVSGTSENAKTKLEEVISLDSNFTSAYAYLARFWMNRGTSSFADMESGDIQKTVFPILVKAISLDEKNFHANFQMARYYMLYQWDFEVAEDFFRKARQLNPSDLESFNLIADLYTVMGRSAEASALVDLCIENNPFSVASYYGLMSFWLNDEPDKAIELSNKALELFGRHRYILPTVIRVYNNTGSYHKVINLLNPVIDSREFQQPRYLAQIAIACNHLNQRGKSDAYLKEIKQKSLETSSGSPSYFLGMCYADRNETDLAFQWLENALQKREPEMIWLMVDPFFRSLHSDSRWGNLLEKVGF